MARLARVVAPGLPHYITQRGNRRQETFFCHEDYEAYISLMAEWCSNHGVQIWAWCLMPNHVHLIAIPESADGLSRAIGEAHRRYTRRINFREGWRGHLWQGRFTSYPMDEHYLLAAARYVELNPVRAKLVEKPEDYPWSSAAAHLSNHNDTLTGVSPLLELVPNWRAFLAEGTNDQEMESIRRHESVGRPLGSKSFLRELENMLGRVLQARKPGRKRKPNK